MKEFIIYLTFGIVIWSCSHPADNGKIVVSLTDFRSERSLEGKKTVYDSILSFRKIFFKNDRLVIGSPSGNSHGNTIHLIDPEHLTYIKGIGKEGLGPGEVDSGIWDFDYGQEDSTFWAYDLSGKKFYEFEFLGESKLSKQTLNQRGDWFLTFSSHWLNDSTIVSYQTRNMDKFGLFSSLGEKVGNFIPWSKEGNPLSEEQAFELSTKYQGHVEIDKRKSTLAHASSKLAYFELYDLATKSHYEFYGPFPTNLDRGMIDQLIHSPKIDVEVIPRGFNDIVIGDHSVFLVHIGKTIDQINDLGETSRQILKFDKKGNPEEIFNLDFPIRSIAVDESQKKIYAISDDQEPGIVVFMY